MVIAQWWTALLLMFLSQVTWSMTSPMVVARVSSEQKPQPDTFLKLLPEEEMESDSPSQQTPDSYIMYGYGTSEEDGPTGRLHPMLSAFLRQNSDSNDEGATLFQRYVRVPGKNFLRFGRRPVEFVSGLLPDIQEEDKRTGKNFLRFGRGPEKNFLRFGKAADKNFLRFGRSAEGEEDIVCEDCSNQQHTDGTRPDTIDPDKTIASDEQAPLSLDDSGSPSSKPLSRKRRSASLFDDYFESDAPPYWVYSLGGYGRHKPRKEGLAANALQKRSHNRNFLRYGRDPVDLHFLRYGKRAEVAAPAGSSEDSDDLTTRLVRAHSTKSFVRFG